MIQIRKSAYRQIRILLLFTFAFLLFNSCKKEKIDFIYDNRHTTEAIDASNVRVINLAAHSQVQLNGDTISNYVVYDPLTTSNPVYPPTRYFPEDGRLGMIWNVPQEVLGNSGRTKLFTERYQFQEGGINGVEFDIHEELEKPKDYYIAQNAVSGSDKRVWEIPRDITAPSQPDHIKVRLVNLAAFSDSPGAGGEDLVGKLKLTYANGTSVSDQTAGIAPGEYSEYTEIPYGTYQFRVLTEDNRQVPATGGERLESTFVIDATTSSLTLSGNSPSYLTFAPIAAYQPGGVYTLVVSMHEFRQPYGNEETILYQNGATVITDLVPPTNTTYARVQTVNALTDGEAIAVELMGGKEIPAVSTGEGSTYISLIQGNYRAKVKGSNGTTLAETEIQVHPNENYSLWVYRDAEDKVQVTPVFNSISGSYYADRENNQDAGLNRYHMDHRFKMRFLNLCPDEPYITFTDRNGQNFAGRNGFPFPASAVENVAFGSVPVESPYVWAPPQNVTVYRSQPGVVPGTWLPEITSLTSQNFINRPELYDVRGNLPTYEPGIYTVALVGRTQSQGSDKAKLIIVKHNK